MQSLKLKSKVWTIGTIEQTGRRAGRGCSRRRQFGWLTRKTVIWMSAIAVSVLVSAAAASVLNQQVLQLGIADKIIRFHVLANSDTQADQELKLKVRDAVGTMLKARMDQVSSMKEGEAVITESLDEIERCAREVITENGYNYPVCAKLDTCSFPQKDYGAFSFPAGEYEALEVSIGAGDGHNWWCVMYPDLCFSGNLYEVDEDNARKQLEKVLTQKEFRSVMEKKDYQVQFKIFTLLRDRKGLK